VFVTRVAGNIVTNEITASLEFGTAVLGSKVLMEELTAGLAVSHSSLMGHAWSCLEGTHGPGPQLVRRRGRHRVRRRRPGRHLLALLQVMMIVNKNGHLITREPSWG
jgi:hypothetical protein